MSAMEDKEGGAEDEFAMLARSTLAPAPPTTQLAPKLEPAPEPEPGAEPADEASRRPDEAEAAAHGARALLLEEEAAAHAAAAATATANAAPSFEERTRRLAEQMELVIR